VGYLVGLSQIATVVKDSEICLRGASDGLISVFCMGADAEGVTIEGLQYSLTDGTLTAGFPLGVSNHFVGKNGKVSVKDGSLLVIYDRKIGISEVCYADL
jgi:thiamine pyrophosphokinase